MSAILEFPVEGVRRLVEHTLANSPWQHPYAVHSPPAPPGLLLVHDQGVYLMSNSQTRLPKSDGTDGSFVVYCAGCDPTVDEEWYEAARSRVGGDDFADLLPIGWFVCALARNAPVITLAFKEEAVEFEPPPFAPVNITFPGHPLRQLPKGLSASLQFGDAGVFLEVPGADLVLRPLEFPEAAPQTQNLAKQIMNGGTLKPIPVRTLLKQMQPDGNVRFQFGPDPGQTRILSPTAS